MRVLMISKACIVGIYQRKLECIAQEGVELLTLVPPSWKDERGEMHLERAYTDGYQLEVIPIHRNGDFHTHYYSQLGTWMKKFRPQVVHIDEEPYNLSAWQMMFHACRVGAKTVGFSWQNILRHYPPPFAWGEKYMLRHLDALIAGSESAQTVWREKGYQKEMAVIPQFGIDPVLFQPKTRPDRPFTIGYFGRFVPEKGVDLLMDATFALEGDWRLRLLGSGPELTSLKAKAESSGFADRIEILDAVPSTEMPNQYHEIDVLVLPSFTKPNWKEQFGRVLVEAMSSGVPVIGSDSGAIPDVIGEGGIIFPEGDTNALTHALTSLRADGVSYQNQQTRGRAWVLQHFTHQQIASATVALYQKLNPSA